MRLILDTNLWSSIGDENVVHEFNDLMATRSIEVVLPPSTLVEVARLPVAAARQQIIHALATGRRRRLASEAQLESNELVAEVRRVRPQWLRWAPDTARVATLNNFWTNRIWREAAEDSQRIHDYEMRSSNPVLEGVVAHQKQQHRELLDTRFNIRPLTALTVTPQPGTPESYLAGWSGEPVEPWRITTRDVYWYNLVVVGGRAALTGEDTTLLDWSGAYLDLRAVRSDRVGFTRFWIDEVECTSMRRHWVRWAVQTAQLNYKVGSGNPADEQHSSYLVDGDVFLSADVRYVAALNIVHTDAPFSVAEPRIVSGDRKIPVLERIDAAL